MNDHQASYVQALLRSRQLSTLATAAAALTVVSSSSAASLVAASSGNEIRKVDAQLAKIELIHGISAAGRGEWVAGYAMYDSALLALKDRVIKG